MRKGSHLAFWVAVVLLGAAVWLSWWAMRGFSPPMCQDPSVSEHCLSYDEIRAWTAPSYNLASRAVARVNSWSTLIIAIFTAVVAIFTVRLWRSTEKLWAVTNQNLQQADQTSRKALRAYLSVEPLGITEYAGHNLLVGRFKVRNIGKTPARDVSIYSTVGLDADATQSDFPIGAPRISPTVLQPGAAMEFMSYEGYPIPAEQVDSEEPLKLGGFFYVWGEVLYTDEFNTTGWTAFCHRYPCEMFGNSVQEAGAGRVRNRSIDPKFARYHEEAGNEAG